MRGHFALVALSVLIVVVFFKEAEAGACRPNPCKNRGRCSVNNKLARGYVCRCRWARLGVHCELHICKLKPCLNKSKCKYSRKNGVVSRTCRCRNGYSGDACDIDACPNEKPCGKKGKCKRRPYGKRYCDCKPGYTGETCAVDVCKPNPCQNNGKCWRRSRGRHSCDCLAGYNGISCDMNACDPNPCMHGGTCTKTRKNRFAPRYVCKCAPGIAGKNCEQYNRVGTFLCKFSVGTMTGTTPMFEDTEECDSWCYIRENSTEQSVTRGCWHPEMGSGTTRSPKHGCGFLDDDLGVSTSHSKQVMCFCREGTCNGQSVDKSIEIFPRITELE